RHLRQRLAPGHGGADGVVSREGRLLEGEHGFAVVHEQEVREAHAASPRNLFTSVSSSGPLSGLARKSVAPAMRPFSRMSSRRSPVSSTIGTRAISTRA